MVLIDFLMPETDSHCCISTFQVPSFPWKDIIKELDHPGFHVSNKSGFENLVKGLFLVVDSFPIDFLYSPWKNKEGQVFINPSIMF